MQTWQTFFGAPFLGVETQKFTSYIISKKISIKKKKLSTKRYLEWNWFVGCTNVLVNFESEWTVSCVRGQLCHESIVSQVSFVTRRCSTGKACHGLIRRATCRWLQRCKIAKTDTGFFVHTWKLSKWCLQTKTVTLVLKRTQDAEQHSPHQNIF